MKTFSIIALVAVPCLALLCWAYRAQKRYWITQGWEVGHKLGRVSGMMGPERMNKWLDEQGIDPKLLPPTR